jgi:hypothetical protein
LAVRRGVNHAALSLAEELVESINGSALAVVASRGSTVAKVLRTGIVDRWLVEVKAIVGRWLRSVVATRWRSRLVRWIGPHLTGVIIVTGRPLGRLWPVVQSALRILVWANENGIVGMGLDMFLQVLRALEGLAAKLTLVRLQGHMHTDVRGDVISLDRSSTARVPLASQVEVVCALAANMALTDVLIEQLGSTELLVAGIPAADESFVCWV